MKYLQFIIHHFFFLAIICSLFIIPISMYPDTITKYNVHIVETSASGKALKSITPSSQKSNSVLINIYPQKRYQKILGFGGSFTEASASLLKSMSPSQREKILSAYFSDEGAGYSLTRTHINSCDFSLGHYAYAMIPEDTLLQHFTMK